MDKHDSPAWEEELSAFVDRQLAPGEKAAVEAHLAHCGSCRGKVRGLEALKIAVSREPASAALPDDLKAALLGEARKQAARKAARAEPGFLELLRAWRAVLVPTGAALALGGALLILQGPPSGASEDAVSVDALLSEHSRYAASRPIGTSEEIIGGDLEENGESEEGL